jgi:hypothetical protein
MGVYVALMSIINLSVLIIGSFLFPAYPVMWLAGTSIVFICVRAAFILLLVTLLLINLARYPLLRQIIGMASAVMILSVLIAAFAGGLPVLDSLTLASAGLAMGIMAVESTNEDEMYVNIDLLRHTKNPKTHAR